MNCIDLEIVEAWDNPHGKWIRRPEIEDYDIYPDWAK